MKVAGAGADGEGLEIELDCMVFPSLKEEACDPPTVGDNWENCEKGRCWKPKGGIWPKLENAAPGEVLVGD